MSQPPLPSLKTLFIDLLFLITQTTLQKKWDMVLRNWKASKLPGVELSEARIQWICQNWNPVWNSGVVSHGLKRRCCHLRKGMWLIDCDNWWGAGDTVVCSWQSIRVLSNDLERDGWCGGQWTTVRAGGIQIRARICGADFHSPAHHRVSNISDAPCFIDFSKAFDSGHWPFLCRILISYGITEMAICVPLSECTTHNQIP